MHGLRQRFRRVRRARAPLAPRATPRRGADRRPAYRRRLRPVDRHRAADEPAAPMPSCASATPTAARPGPAATPPAASPQLLMRETGQRAGSPSTPSPATCSAEAAATGGSPSIWGRRGSTGATSRWRAPMDTLHLDLAVGPLAIRWRSTWATRTRRSSSPMPRRSIWRARPAARARSAVPRARQYRRRRRCCRRPHPAARLGARRRA